MLRIACAENWQIMCNISQDYARHFAELCANYIQGHLRLVEMIRLSRACASSLAVFHCNYGCISYHFRDKASYWQKITIFSYVPHWMSPLVGPHQNTSILFHMEN